jgi:hypothetical protein
VAERIAWGLLALIHLSPAVAVLIPGTITRFYGVPEQGTVGILLQHRSVLFMVVVAICVWAAFAPAVRPLAAFATAISVIGFLIIYTWHGLPAGPLRTIAWADLVAILPLAFVCWRAWSG